MDVRNFGIQQILEIRDAAPFKRVKKIPKVKIHAKRWWELIDLKTEGITEPPFTMSFSFNELQNYLKSVSKLEVVILPAHSQSVERCVKFVTEASQAIYDSKPVTSS